MKKQNNSFLGVLTFMLIINVIALVFEVLGINTGYWYSLTLAIIIVNALMFLVAIWIVGNSDDKKESGDK